MLYLALSFFMVLPMLGVAVMETGEVSPFIDEPGRANGASLAYAVHLVAFFAAFLWVLRRRRASRRPRSAATREPAPTAATLDNYALLCATTFLVLALLMLFAYGGVNVLSLAVDKAEFRISLGPFGAIMTLATKWLMPAMFAALVRACMDRGWTRWRKVMTSASGVSLCVMGASWGFKTTIILMLLPALILAAWRLSPRTLAWLFALVVLNVVGLSLFFDQHEDLGVALDALLFRLTALQGDLAWYMWDRTLGGYDTPGYLRTYLPVFGDAVLRLLTGADPARSYAEWASYYFGPSMTLYGGYPVEGVMEGVTNQATLFAESLVIGGKYLFFVASFAFGAIVGMVARTLRTAIASGHHALAATLATFFSFTVLSWMLGNGLSSLLYLINVVGALGSLVLIRACLRRPIRMRRRLP